MSEMSAFGWVATLPAYCNVSNSPRISRVRGSIDEIRPCSHSVCAPSPSMPSPSSVGTPSGAVKLPSPILRTPKRPSIFAGKQAGRVLINSPMSALVPIANTERTLNYVAEGSTASLWPCPRHVRSSPNSGAIADIAALRVRATSRHLALLCAPARAPPR